MLERIKRIFYLAIINILVMVTVTILMGLLEKYAGIHFGNGFYAIAMYGVIVGMSGAFINLLMSRWLAKRTYNIQLFDTSVSDSKLTLVYQIVQELTQSHGLPMPEVGIYQSPEPNAFATGPSKSSALVAVSSGLVQNMNENEIRGVLGHEMTHLINGDMITMTLVQGVMNTFVFVITRLIGMFISGNRDDRGPGIAYFILVPILQIIFGSLAGIIINWVSRRREYAADKGGAQLMGKDAMISALQKLQSIEQNFTMKADEFSTLKFYDTGSWGELRMTHPTLENRIRALQSL